MHFDVDTEKVKLLGVSLDDVNVTLQSTFGAFYVNDFNRGSHAFRAQVQADGAFRARLANSCQSD